MGEPAAGSLLGELRVGRQAPALGRSALSRAAARPVGELSTAGMVPAGPSWPPGLAAAALASGVFRRQVTHERWAVPAWCSGAQLTWVWLSAVPWGDQSPQQGRRHSPGVWGDGWTEWLGSWRPAQGSCAPWGRG